MSDGSDSAPDDASPLAAARHRRRVLIPTLVTLAILLFLGAVFTGIWTDRLWFKAVGFSSVFRTMISTRVILFVAFGFVFAAVVVVNIVIAYRTRPRMLRPANPNDPVVRYRQVLDPLRKLALIVLGVALFVFSGSAASGHWTTFLMWRNRTPFHQDDVFFHKDIGFFVFDYPWFRFLVSFCFALLVVSGIAVALLHYVYGGIALQGKTRHMSRSAQIHLSILIGIGMLLKALSYWLDRFGLAMSNSGLFTGIGYTDANARIPSKNILMVIAVICALLFFANTIRRSWLLPGIGVGLLALTALLIGGIWPAVMQSFQVKPSEPGKEGPYIAKNIKSTRDAYDVADVQTKIYTAKTDLNPSELAASAESRVSTRLLDPTLVQPAFEQLQQVRGYYTMPQTLDVDRYQLKGDKEPEDVVISARELNLAGLPDSQRSWPNDHTVYTHGYGIIAAKGNVRGPNGDPAWVEKNIPGEGQLDVTQPRIYYGGNSPSYSIVGQPKGATPIEVDTPQGGTGSNESSTEKEDVTQNTYDGKGGVPVGGMLHKLLYAAKFSEPNIVLSDRVNPDSKILYNRKPRQRVRKVAPWLTADGDPYPAVVDGRVKWIVDAYTTSDSYPYSEKVSLDDATSDTLTGQGAQARLPSDQINYMRNSVKAVVDAYDGTVDLYQWDTKDPILKTWMKTFPGVVKPKSDISEALRAHLRYPVDLFKVQRKILAEYHVTNAQTFYQGGEKWKIPEDPAVSDDTLQPPYYLTMSRPGEETPRFSLTTVYLPNNRQNLASFMSVNSEASDKGGYGKIQILQLTSKTQVDGPSQIANAFQSDRGVSQALLQYKQTGTKILYGNLLTLPVGDGLLYVQPVYIKRNAQEGAYPVLQFVIASFGEKVGFGQSLDEALRVALGIEKGNAPPVATGKGSANNGGGKGSANKGGENGSQGTQSATSLIKKAQNEYDAAQKALKDSDLSAYQKHINKMAKYLNQVQKALGATPQTSSPGPPTASKSKKS